MKFNLISKTVGETNLTVLGAVYIIDFVPSAIWRYLYASISNEISYLIGQNINTNVLIFFVIF
jgi:hypothetical protein